MSTRPPTRVSLVAIPKAMPSILVGLHDVLSSVGALPTLETPIEPAPFEAEIVGGVPGRCACHGGACHACAHPPGADATDIVLVPSLLADGGRWATGRHPN